MKYLKINIFIIIIIFLFTSCNNSQIEKPEIQKGVLNLSTWNFDENGTVDLNGEWEFYWEQLLEPKNFKLDTSTLEFINVPYSWTKPNNQNKSFPEFGYATYRLKIILPDKQSDYKFWFSTIFSSSKVWINDSLCFVNGVVATTKEKSEPNFYTDYIIENHSYNTSDTLEIIIQVADYYRGGPYAGLIRKIIFGHSYQINKKTKSNSFIKSAVIGILLLIALYHMFLFFYKKDYSYLIFSLLSLIVASRAFFIAGIFTGLLSYSGCFVFAFFPIILYPLFILTFFYFLYKNEVHKQLLYTILILTLIFIPFVFSASANMINKFEPYSAILGVSIVLYLEFYTLLLAVKRKRQGAIFALIGVTIILISSIHDALFSQGIIFGFGTYITEIGFVLYIILQSLNLAQIFSFSLNKNIELNKELNYQNVNLEKIVKKRTHEITQQNEEIITQNEEIRQQNETLNKKNKAITSSINYAQKIQSALMPPEDYISELLQEIFILNKPRDIVSGDFYWIKQIKNNIILVSADCTGHGVPGAFMSMLGISFLNEIVIRREITHANIILNELRRLIKHSLRQNITSDVPQDGIDMSLCVIDTKTNKMQYSGAYNPLYLIKNSDNQAEITEYKADRIPVGVYFGKDKAFTNHEIQLETGDIFYIFSDGYIDQIGGDNNKKFMSRNFKKLLLEIHNKPMLTQKEILEETHKKWMNKYSQLDDILIIGLRI